MKIRIPKITKARLFSKRFIGAVIVIDAILILILVGTYSLANTPGPSTIGESADFSKVNDCFLVSDVDRQKCLDAFISSYANTTKKTVRQILADLETLRSSNSSIETNCHVLSHSIGRYTYTQYANVGEAFEACDLTCNSGCFHGVMERMFFNDDELDEGTQHLSYQAMAEKVPGICDDSKFANPTSFMMFQCFHGLGHAVNFFSKYDLDQALRLCDLVDDQFDRNTCYGGAFMENVTAFERSKRDLKSDDPHYPCNRVDDKYKYECYGMQTSVMIEQGLTDKEMADECRKAGDFTAKCFESYGRDLSNHVRAGKTAELVKDCEIYASGYEDNCINTAVAVLIDSASSGRFAYMLCDALTQESNRLMCSSAVVKYLRTSFYKNDFEILQDCKDYSTDDARCESVI